MLQEEGFPKTTNQDYHNEEPFDKLVKMQPIMDKQNYKKHSKLMQYCDAMFNKGVFVNPWQD